MTTVPTVSATDIYPGPKPSGLNLTPYIRGGRPFDSSNLTGIRIAEYLADTTSYPVHNIFPDFTWPQVQRNHFYHMFKPHTEVLKLYSDSLEGTLRDAGVPAEKIDSVTAKIFKPFSTLYNSFVTQMNHSTYYSDYFYYSGLDSDCRFDSLLRTCRILNWFGIASIIGGLGSLAAQQYFKPKTLTTQRIAIWGGCTAIAGGLLALAVSTVKMHQFKV